MTDRDRTAVRPASTTGSTGLSFGSWAFAFGPFAADPWDFARICRYVADAGYDAIEINGFRPHPHDEELRGESDLGAIRAMVDEAGLGISGYAPDLTSTPPAEVSADRYLARIDSAIDFCVGLRIATLRVDSVSAPGPFDRDRFDHLVSTWRSAARRSADRGVGMVWEFEPGFWLNRPSEVVRLLDAVDDENFRVMFDTSHAYTGAVAGARQGPDPELLDGGVVEYARLLAGRIGALHLIDSDGSLHDDETSEHLMFGTGEVPFAEVLATLGDEALALPWWTVDFCFSPTTETDGRAAVPIVRQLLTAAREASR